MKTRWIVQSFSSPCYLNTTKASQFPFLTPAEIETAIERSSQLPRIRRPPNEF